MANEKKDRRKKGCTNSECQRHIDRYFYPAEESFCSLCGSPLVYVCIDCFTKLEDNPDKHKRCSHCEAEKDQKGGFVKYKLDHAGTRIKGQVKSAADKISEGVTEGFETVKEKAPELAIKAKEIAKQPKAKKAVKGVAVTVAEIVDEKVIKNEDAKKVIKAITKNIK